jgi:hypothetical protein
MTTNLTRVTITGYPAQEPVLRALPTGQHVCELVADDERCERKER